jgi:hypothetical protein
MRQRCRPLDSEYSGYRETPHITQIIKVKGFGSSMSLLTVFKYTTRFIMKFIGFFGIKNVYFMVITIGCYSKERVQFLQGRGYILKGLYCYDYIIILIMALFVCRNVGVSFVVTETKGEIKSHLIDLVKPDGCNRRNWNTYLLVPPCGAWGSVVVKALR